MEGCNEISRFGDYAAKFHALQAYQMKLLVVISEHAIPETFSAGTYTQFP